MSFKDVLLQIGSYPEPAPVSALEWAVGFAGRQGARLTMLTFQIEIPRVGNALANMLLDLPGMIAAEEKKSLDNARSAVALFTAAARDAGVPHGHMIVPCGTSHVGSIVAEHARMRDMTIVPAGEHSGLQHYIAECVVFGSGRPMLLLPEAAKRSSPARLDVVGVAWDFSRPAARAVADAMPIIRNARTVRIVTVTQEKAINTECRVADLISHLACHGVEAVAEEEAAAGRSIGQALEAWTDERQIDLLVMGAYGHSRLRDFVLGGATKTIISRPKLPVLLSH